MSNIENNPVLDDNNKEEEIPNTNIVNELSKVPDEEIIKFKMLAKKYFEIDDQIRVINKDLRDKKTARKVYSEKIIKFMDDFKIDNLNTNSGKLKYYTSLEKKKLNKENLKFKLTEFFNNNTEKALDCFKYLDDREKIERKRLKRFK